MAKVVEGVTQFAHQEYNILNYWETGLGCLFGGCLCAPLSKMLILEPENVVVHVKSCCAETNERKPYGEITDVAVTNSCVCCWSVNEISPGCGCNKELVTEIKDELTKRVKSRGNQGQIQRAEETRHLLLDIGHEQAYLHEKIDALMNHLKVQIPAKAPKPEVMGQPAPVIN